MWNLEGLMKTLSTKSESVIETYRRDLKEFGLGLRKEIEVAQGTVGHTIDGIGSSVLKGTAQIISQGKEALLTLENSESDYSSSDNNTNNNNNNNKNNSKSGLSSKRYSRFDAQVRGVQGDSNTYTEVPEDKEEYEKWKMGFGFEGKREEMRRLLEENGEMGSIYGRVVPGIVEEDEFWFRYYYKVYKLRQAEDVRANIVRRAISRDEEELSWDVDDDNEEVEEVGEEDKKSGLEENVDLDQGGSVEVVKDEVGSGVREVVEPESVVNWDEDDEKRGAGEHEGNVDVKEVKDEEGNSFDRLKVEKLTSSGGNVPSEKVVNVEKRDRGNEIKSDEKVGVGDVPKVGEFSDVLRHPPVKEEDLEWDEIEDLSSIDENKLSQSTSPNKIDLQKRLTAAEEEDLSWDIEDDDEEQVKA